MNEENFIDRFFPDKYWAVALPCYGATIIYTLLMILLGLVFTCSYKYVDEDEYKKLNSISKEKKKN